MGLMSVAGADGVAQQESNCVDNGTGGQTCSTNESFRGAAVYLITYGDDKEQMMDFFDDMKASIRCLWKHYLRHHGHALVIFHAGELISGLSPSASIIYLYRR
jgi:hypothetical protein